MKLKSVLFGIICLLSLNLAGQAPYNIVSVEPDFVTPGQTSYLTFILDKPLQAGDSVSYAGLWMDYTTGGIDLVYGDSLLVFYDTIVEAKFTIPDSNYLSTCIPYLKFNNYPDSVGALSIKVSTEISAITPQICMVSVDTANKYLVSWYKPSVTTIDSVNIYKETNVNNKYVKIGVRAYDAAPVFEDPATNPTRKAEYYKISFVDQSRNESKLSNSYKSLRLNLNNVSSAAAGLSWNYYAYYGLTYYIYRGVSKDDMVKIDEISGDLGSYVDIAPPPGDLLYQIALVEPDPCVIGSTASDTTSLIKSNFVEYSNTGPVVASVNEQEKEKGLSIYPNPVKDELFIRFDNTVLKNAEVSLYDMTGRLVHDPEVITGNATLDFSDLTSGTYLLKIRDNDTIFSRVVVKE